MWALGVFMERFAMTDLWSPVRYGNNSPTPRKDGDHRTDAEKDYDRILFSGAVRRLADKTQVFPLDKNDSVRKRLTHSHEVANLAKSIGLRVFLQNENAFQTKDFFRTVAPTLASAGIAHDLGNPPFGHQGEAAIQQWFAKSADWIFTKVKPKGSDLSEALQHNYREEFANFDGNPQSLRLIAKLQTAQGNKGLDLTAATLASSMKYVVGAGNTEKNAGKKKMGYFCSEQAIVIFARSKTGLKEGQRHPVAWITEAADDTAYSVLDLEDSIKKGILSPEDVLNSLRSDCLTRDKDVVNELVEKFKSVDEVHRAPSIRREVKSGYLRSILIDHLVKHAAEKFLHLNASILDLTNDSELLDDNPIASKLKEIALQFAFLSTPVLKEELLGKNAIVRLIDEFWFAITDRKDPLDIHSKRLDAKSRLIWSIISDNYIEASRIDNCEDGDCRNLRYRELRLLTDMVSGMTDKFAIELDRTLQSLQ